MALEIRKIVKKLAVLDAIASGIATPGTDVGLKEGTYLSKPMYTASCSVYYQMDP